MNENHSEFISTFKTVINEMRDSSKFKNRIDYTWIGSVIDSMSEYLEYKDNPASAIPWIESVTTESYFQVIDPTSASFKEVKKFKEIEKDDDIIYLVFEDGFKCNADLILPLSEDIEDPKELLSKYFMVELTSEDETWILERMPESYPVQVMLFSDGTSNPFWSAATKTVDTVAPEKKNVIIIPHEKRCLSLSSLYRNHTNNFKELRYMPASTNGVMVYECRSSKDLDKILRKYYMGSYGYDEPSEWAEKIYAILDKADKKKDEKPDSDDEFGDKVWENEPDEKIDKKSEDTSSKTVTEPDKKEEQKEEVKSDESKLKKFIKRYITPLYPLW